MLAAFILATLTPALASKDYRDVRYRNVFGQTDWYTCGPAALATLFTFYYAKPVSEAAITRLSVQDMASRGKDPRAGVTLLALRNAGRARGIDATGYRLDFGQLEAVLKSGLPVLVNTVQPQAHFSVALAVVGDTVLLADPSWGLKAQPRRWFLDAWNGVTLIPSPDATQAARARAEVRKVVAAYHERVDRLRSGM